MSELQINQPAPGFELAGSDGKTHRLSDYQGRWLILFFYPKDNTPGCTQEACAFRNTFDTLSAMDCAILGINTDSIDSHKHFIQKQQLPFPLLSDPTGQVSQHYGCLFKLGPIKFCKRHSFIIDPNGRLSKIYRRVIPRQHADEIIQFLTNQGATPSA